MSSKPRLRAHAACVALSLVFVLFDHVPVRAQVYFTGPYGPGETWNLYEHRGFLGSERFAGAGQASTWLEAHQDAIGRMEPLSGANMQGHLAAFSGPTAQQENDFVANRLRGEWSSGWIGLTDNEAFGGGEAGGNGMAGLGNPPGDGIGWKWTSGEVFDFANWAPNSPRQEDFVGLHKWGTWFAGSSSGTSSYIVEYETRSPVAINLPPMPQPSLLPGPPIRAGAFAIREIVNNGPIEGPGNGGSVRGAIQSLQNIGPNAIVRDYYAPIIDHQAEEQRSFGPFNLRGPNRPFEVLQREDVRVDQLDDFVMVAHAQILIPEGQGGDWTFNVTSDDGFELYIPGARFEPGDGSPLITPYGSMTFPFDTAAHPTLGYVSLAPGVHDIELVYYEDEIRSSVELSAAPGRKARFDNSFILVGTPAQNLLRGRTPVVTDAFQFTNVHRIPNDPGVPTPDEQITSLAQARQLLSSADGNDTVVNFQSPTVNYDNITRGRDGSNQHGRYAGDQTVEGLGNDFASIARNTLSITTAGTYTFGFSVLDGGELTIGGAQFTENFGEGIISNGGQSLLLDRSMGDGVAFAAVDQSPTTRAGVLDLQSRRRHVRRAVRSARPSRLL